MQPGAPHDQPAAEADARPDLEQLDEALAMDVERLLHGSVEEVEQVLDGLFEETAESAIDARMVSISPPSPARSEATVSPAMSASLPVGPRPPATREATAPTPEPSAPALRGVLGLINAPVHWLSPNGRRVVDWLAITLVLWVPVIWFLVLAMRG